MMMMMMIMTLTMKSNFYYSWVWTEDFLSVRKPELYQRSWLHSSCVIDSQSYISGLLSCKVSLTYVITTLTIGICGRQRVVLRLMACDPWLQICDVTDRTVITSHTLALTWNAEFLHNPLSKQTLTVLQEKQCCDYIANEKILKCFLKVLYFFLAKVSIINHLHD